jgi:thiol-disulfide isomerase/thioredoxin
VTQPFDVVAFGATSFVGQILAGELLQTFGRSGPLRWALAGRSLPKLEALRRSLGPQASDVPLIVADAADPAALQALCAQTRVVASTVGPYALHGSPLVQACAESGTDYVDLTGELQWIRRMLQQHEAGAKHSGARIVHCCGFDSIPSDLGVLHLQTQARQRFGAPCPRVKMRVKAMKGAASGGTDALQPLAHWARPAVASPAQALGFQRVRSAAELDAALRTAGRPVVLDFYADWCVSCKELERLTYSDAGVAARLGKALLLKADVTANSDDDKALLRRFRLFGPPGTLFFDAQGREIVAARVIGFQGVRRFDQTLASAGL